MKKNLTIKSILGISLKNFKDYVKSCYRIGVNPFYGLAKVYPEVEFRFISELPDYIYEYPFAKKEKGKPYILVYYDRDTGKICITLQKDGETKIYRPTHKEMGL